MNYYYEIVPKEHRLPIRCFRADDRTDSFFPPHWHTEIEILFVLSGKITVTVNGTAHDLENDQFLIVHSNHIHSLYTFAGTSAYMLQISQSFLTESCEDCPCLQYDTTLGTAESVTSVIKLRNCLENLCEMPLPKEKYDYLHQKSLLYEIIYLLVQNFCSETAQPDTSQDEECIRRLISIAEYLNQNFRRKLTLTGLAEKYGLAPAYFSRFFKKYMGLSLTSYLDIIRLDHAFNLVKNTNYPILQICEESGFVNYPVFIKKFRKRYGDTPSNLRTKSSRDATI